MGEKKIAQLAAQHLVARAKGLRLIVEAAKAEEKGDMALCRRKTQEASVVFREAARLIEEINSIKGK